MRNKLFLSIILICVLKNNYAQKITTIPFEELYGGVILIKAQVGDNKDTLNFIFDTGSSHISLDSATAEMLHLPVIKTENYINGIGGLRRVSKSHPLTLHLPNLNLDSLIFNVNDYTTLQESYGQRIDGIIGFAFINRFILNVNFDSSIINVYPRGNYKYPKRGYLWKYNLNFLPTTNLEVKDAKKMILPLYIDCGAGLALLLTEAFIKDTAILHSKKKPLVAQIEGIAGKATTRLTTVKEFKLGPYKFKKVPTYLYEDKNDLLSYPAVVGLLGNDILRRFNWVLNYAKKEMHLMPNKLFDDPFDYSYTGLSIYLVDGFITITEIMENSPASNAGFAKGDIIFSIESALITKLKQAKDSFQNTSKKIKVIVLRDGKLKELKMKVLSIL